jgi:TRAP-type C4-dicarboxylate transport system permease small subunit
MDKVLKRFYGLLMVLSGVSMVATFAVIVLGIVSRLANFDVPGLDAYAGYFIAAALFFALPGTLQHGDHIRVTLLLDRLSPRVRAGVEWWCLGAAAALTAYIAWYAGRAVWISYITHDVSPSADASPLWIPQLAMAVGAFAFALSFIHALLLRLGGKDLIASSSEAAHIE